MRMVDLIEKKRDGYELSYEELEFIINSYVSKEIPDYQVSALLMAIYFNKMTKQESTDLALLMAKSGDMLDLSIIDGLKVDKHSTGGVGDKTSLIIGPILASLGIKFAKMSGRGLGHTGGTIDKLEAINGFNVSLEKEDFIKQIQDINISIISQTGDLAPADKLLYALRDVTATVESTALIASSIMSKKLASGADAICLDVKVGSGAFMKTLESALELAGLMCDIGKLAGRKMTAILTNMDEPLGYAIGNTLEIIEVIDTLNGNGPKDLLEIVINICAYLAIDAHKFDNFDDAYNGILEVINNKSALNKFIEFIEAQGGDSSYIKDVSKFNKAKYITSVKSKTTGYVSKLDAFKIGVCAMTLGAGRRTKEDIIDFSVGVVLNKKINDYVQEGDVLAYIHSNCSDVSSQVNEIIDSYSFSDKEVSNNLILEIVR